jgi:hypothetical protein
VSTGGRRPKYRTIREEPSYTYCVERLGLDARHVDELTGQLRWRLSREPVAQSFGVPGRQTRITFTEELGNVPVFRVFFHLPNDELVSLLWIENVDDAPPYGFDDFLDT